MPVRSERCCSLPPRMAVAPAATSAPGAVGLAVINPVQMRWDFRFLISTSPRPGPSDEATKHHDQEDDGQDDPDEDHRVALALIPSRLGSTG